MLPKLPLGLIASAFFHCGTPNEKSPEGLDFVIGNGYNLRMSSVAIAMLLKPLAALVFFGLILLPIRLAVQKWWPDGKVKQLLLRRVD